jgi:hypothetical protein
MNTKLNQVLQNLHQAELELQKIICGENRRFSINKLTGDLGEYYALNDLEKSGLFKTINQSNTSNNSYDLLGLIEENSILKNNLNLTSDTVRIEVKTRRNQSGAKYLSGVKPDQFDLLCMVDIKADYTLNCIYLISSNKAKKELDINYNRLIFKNNMAFNIIIDGKLTTTN